jgi:hypothetical protein
MPKSISWHPETQARDLLVFGFASCPGTHPKLSRRGQVFKWILPLGSPNLLPAQTAFVKIHYNPDTR